MAVSKSNPSASKKNASIILPILGAVALGVGYYAGFVGNREPVLAFVMFGASIGLFAIALALSFLARRAHPMTASALVVPTPTMKAIQAPEADTAAQQRPQLPKVTAEVVPATPRFAARTVAAIPVASNAGPQVQPKPPGPIGSAGPIDAPARGSLDVATLMQAPLADLLLAAMCKDAEGARRIFRQALLNQAEPAEAAQVSRK